MTVKILNTLSRELEEVVPIEEGRIRLYTCGPTVYDFAHIGNFRAYIFEDLLRRYLEYRGFKVTHVMNLTDVDDKTIRAANEKGVPLKEYTRPFIDAFFEDLKALNIIKAHVYPAATDHIPEMIGMIQVLIDKGFAYKSEDGSVYYNIQKFKPYGCLARINLEGMQAGARVDQDEYEKDHVGDFALWKAWDEDDGDVYWDAPWGRGRPGWHIECSAMSIKHLGESFDMHCGGIDNMFPHHEDEIAQSEAATGKQFVKYWLHCAHLVVEGQKMSKSLGNFYTLRQLFEKGWTGREVRYVLISTHYRQSLNFTFDGLKGARASLQRIDAFTGRLQELVKDGVADERPCNWAEEARERFTAALDDDLNISGGLAALFDMITAGNRALDEGSCKPGEAASALSVLRGFEQVLGCIEHEEDSVPRAVQDLVEQRQAARAEKNWSESDRLRDEIQVLGWMVKDTREGPRVNRIR